MGVNVLFKKGLLPGLSQGGGDKFSLSREQETDPTLVCVKNQAVVQ